MMHGRIITFQFLMQDKPGLLSALLAILAERKVNIQTINSIIPTNSCAVVTISAETIDLDVSLEELLDEVGQLSGVIKAEIIAG
jgi:chorismate mutase